MLCRYAVQRALLLKDIREDKPETMVNIARRRDLLSEIAVRNCRAAVFMGDKAGHPQSDPLDNITDADAKQALLATRRVLLELFNPAGVL